METISFCCCEAFVALLPERKTPIGIECKMKILIILFLLLALTPAIVPAQMRNPLVGTWNLIAYEDTPEKGRTEFPWGKHPSGVLIYDDTGHMAVQIQRTPGDRSIAKSESKLTSADKLKLLGAYTAYFGTYSVVWEQMTITHHITGNLFPVYIGSDQVKGFALDGDRLTLNAKWTVNGKRWSGTRIFERMKPMN